MKKDDQDFLDEIRALLKDDDSAIVQEQPAQRQPAQKPPAEKPPRQREKKPKKRQKKTPEPPQDGRPRTRKPKKAPFPWVLLFLILLVGAGLIYAGLQYKDSQENPETLPPETTEETLAPQEPGQTLTIAAVGDVTFTDELAQAALQPDGTYDFSKAFLQAAPVLSGADLAVANLDVNFCGAPYGSDTHSAPYALAEALAGAGIDMAQMANSYSVVNGIDGLASSLTAVRQAGMEPLGAYATESDYAKNRGITVCEVNGFRIVFLALTKGVNNLSLPDGHSHCVNLLYQDYNTTYAKVDTEGIQALLDAAAEQKPDITIAMVHWGSEYETDISKTQTQIRDLLLSGGVDVILGTHSHRVGELTVETGKEKDTVTAYSLGNFYGDDSMSGTQSSLILQLEFTMDNLSGGPKLTDVSYTPLYLASPEQSGTQGYEVLNLDTALQLKERNYIFAVDEATAEVLKAAKESIAKALGDSLEIWKAAK